MLHPSIPWECLLIIDTDNRDYLIAVHFNNFKHDISSFRFQGIEKVTLPERGGNTDEEKYTGYLNSKLYPFFLI